MLNFDFDECGNLKFDKRNNAPTLKNQYYNFDAAMGINYLVDVSKLVGEKVKILSMQNGSTFDENKIYKVAVNSYRGNGGGNHLIVGAGIPKKNSQKELSHQPKKISVTI